MLPSNATREQNKIREEVVIPPPQRRPPMTNERLISCDELNPIGRLAFTGFKSLNRIQSIVYPAAYKSNDNLLVCAPTGAGKTNIAMLSILRTVEQVRFMLFVQPATQLTWRLVRRPRRHPKGQVQSGLCCSHESVGC